MDPKIGAFLSKFLQTLARCPEKKSENTRWFALLEGKDVILFMLGFGCTKKVFFDFFLENKLKVELFLVLRVCL